MIHCARYLNDLNVLLTFYSYRLQMPDDLCGYEEDDADDDACVAAMDGNYTVSCFAIMLQFYAVTTAGILLCVCACAHVIKLSDIAETDFYMY